MFRNKIIYIFIYTLIVLSVGCDGIEGIAENVMSSSYQDIQNWTDENEYCWDDDINLNVSLPGYNKDNNGYYHIDFLEGYVQTFVNVQADTGNDDTIIFVEWMSNLLYNYQGTLLSPVNTSSYSNDDGIAISVLGVWEPFIGDTLVVTAGCVNNCGEQSIDSMKIIVE